MFPDLGPLLDKIEALRSAERRSALLVATMNMLASEFSPDEVTDERILAALDVARRVEALADLRESA